MLLSFTSSALTIDTTANYDKMSKGYPEISLKTWFGLPLIGEEIFKGTIEEHTTSCSSDCSSTIKVLVKEGLPYYDSIKFIRTDTNKEVQIYSYKIEKKVSVGTIKVPTYENVCVNDKPLLNGTIPLICEVKETGFRDEEQYTYEEITPETKSDGQEIEIRISGNKKSTWEIDWQLTTNGEDLGSIWAVWGSLISTAGLKAYWNFSETSGTTAKDSLGIYNVSVQNGQQTSGGKIGYGYSAGGNTNALSEYYPTQNTTVNAWIKRTGSFGGMGMFLGDNEAGASTEWYLQADAYDNLDLWGQGTLAGCNVLDITLTQDVWYMLTIVVNQTGIRVYKNGASHGSCSDTDAGLSDKRFRMFNAYLGSYYFLTNAIGDEIGIWDRSLSSSEITALYNSGTGIAYPFSSSSITLNSPANNNVSVSKVNTFNITASPTSPATLVNISLWTNSSGVWSIKNVTTTSGKFMTLNFPTNGNYLWGASACDSDGDCGVSSVNYTITINKSAPTLSLISPANSYQTIQTSNVLSCNATSSNGASLVNISLWTNNTGWRINQTNIATTSFNSTSFTYNIPIGNYNWTCSACDSDGDCGVSGNRTIGIVSTLINSVSYNASVYETESQTYTINASGLLTSASLVYNGTTYAGTISGDTATYTQTLPASTGNKSFYWSLNSGATLSNTYNQNVKAINLTWCNYASPINTTYINFTFKDEATNTAMNGTIDSSTWTYSLAGGSVEKTLIYANTSTSNPNHPFCFSPSDKSLNNNRSVQYSFTGYPQRRYSISDTLTNSTTQKVLYLLSSSDGIYVTFQVIDGAGKVRPGIEVTVYRDISGVSTIIEQGTTDGAGTVTFWLNPNYDHTFVFSSTDCSTASTTIRPTQNQYTQSLTCGGESDYFSSNIDGVSFLKYPTPGIINPGVTTFYYQVYSKTLNITQVKFDLINTSNTVLNTTTKTCGPRNCTTTLVYNVTNSMSLKGRYYVNFGSGFVLLEADAYWRAIVTNVSDWGTIKSFTSNFRDLFFDWSDTSSTCGNYNAQATCNADLACKWFEENGRTHCIPNDESNKLEYSRIVLIFFLLCIIIAFFSKFTGYSQAYPGSTVYILTGLIIFGSIVGGTHCANNQCVGLFQYSGLFNGSSYASGFLNNYIFAILASIFTLGHMFKHYGEV
jgi:hypothetical protein